jgi:glycerol kinase
MPFVLALDQGTTSSRAIVFDEAGRKLSQAQVPLPQIFPQAGWVEHDPEVMWQNQLAVARKAIADADVAVGDISAIGIGNQRETVVVWDRKTGIPVANAIVWQDRRTAHVTDAMIRAGVEPSVREKTGLPVDPYFSATKIAWILDNVNGARPRAELGDLACGTVDSWFVWKLTGGEAHVTDATNASRYLLLDIERGTWDSDLCDLFGVPMALLPQVVRSSGEMGVARSELLGAAIPIASACGDQQAALAGNGGFSAGDAKATFGTGIFALTHTGRKRARSEHLAVTLAAQTDAALEYALEGSIFMGGAVVQWIVEGLKLADTPAAAQALAESVSDSNGVVFVPALTGLGAPEWDPLARGSIFGLTRGATDAHVARAAMEAIPLQVSDLVNAMAEDSGTTLEALRVDGGVTVNHLVMQTLADVLDIPVQVAAMAESTALGAAYLAGRAVGVWRSPDDLPMLREIARTYEPNPADRERLADLKVRWAEAVKRSMKWERE